MARKPKAPSKASVKAAADRAEAAAKGDDVTPEPTPLDPEVVSETRGRKTKYKPEYAKVAEQMCALGATDYDLAQAFDVTTVTIWNWQTKHEEFFNALHASKEAYDKRIERSLAQRAAGYTYNAEKVFCFRGEVTRAEVAEHVPPDPGAAKMWLSARKKEWREPASRHEITGKDGEPLAIENATGYEQARRVAFAMFQAIEAEQRKTIDADSSG